MTETRKRITADEIETLGYVSAEERETCILIQGNKMSIYTSDNTTMTKIRKNMIKNPSEWKCFEGPRNRYGKVTGYFIEAPKTCLKLKANSKKQLSEETKAAASERFKKLSKEGKLGKKSQDSAPLT